MNLDEVRAEFDRLSNLIDAANDELEAQGAAWADAERDYRRAKAEAWARCPNDEAGTKAADKEWTAARREAWVNAETAEARYKRDLADALKRAAWQSAVSRQTQVSALQTIVKADQSRAEFARTGPEAA